MGEPRIRIFPTEFHHPFPRGLPNLLQLWIDFCESRQAVLFIISSRHARCVIVLKTQYQFSILITGLVYCNGGKKGNVLVKHERFVVEIRGTVGILVLPWSKHAAKLVMFVRQCAPFSRSR